MPNWFSTDLDLVGVDGAFVGVEGIKNSQPEHGLIALVELQGAEQGQLGVVSADIAPLLDREGLGWAVMKKKENS